MTDARAAARTGTEPKVRDAAAVVYRLYDVGYSIHLDRALDLLAASAPERVRPVRGEAQAIQIANPPITVILGAERASLAGVDADIEVSARIFDFGVVSLRARVPLPGEPAWSRFSSFGAALDDRREGGRALRSIFDQHLRLLTERIAPAVERPMLAPVTEDYTVYRASAVVRPDGTSLGAAELRELDVTPLLLNETRPLSADARRELLPHRFSYYGDDLAILTWESALVVEPEPHDADVQYILEFANAQLLELRFYDAALDAELPNMYDRIATARSASAVRTLFGRRYARLLADLQQLVADSTEIVERAENSLKVTDDVYLARVYSSALEIFRARAWRAGVDRKLAIIRETYGMLNAESQAARAEALEMAIVLLIVADIVMGMFGG